MSAFIVRTGHIDALLSFAEQQEMLFDHIDGALVTLDAVGQALSDENYRSVNYRYDEDTEVPRYTFQRHPRRLSAIEVMKAASCLDYQSCECPDYQSSSAAKIIRQIHSRASRCIDGYDDAPWCVEDGRE